MRVMKSPGAAPVDSDAAAARTARHGVVRLEGLGRSAVHALIGPVLVDDVSVLDPKGAVFSGHANAVWQWLCRDVDQTLSTRAVAAVDAPDPGPASALCAEVGRHLADAIASAAAGEDQARRVRVQIGSIAAYECLDQLEVAFRSRPLLAQALAFGQAFDELDDDVVAAAALKSFPASTRMYPFLMHAAVGRIASPYKLVSALVEAAGGCTETAVLRSGLEPVMDALVAHAQHLLAHICRDGPFIDMDQTCRAIHRFHGLVRAGSIVTENDGRGRWAVQTTQLVARVSDYLAPRLHRVEADLRQSLRPSRFEADAADSTLLLEALNGIYLLSTIREARDSLGVNAAFETVWAKTGNVLEMLIERNLDAFRQNPGDEMITRRLEAAVNMARIRFNPEYADIVQRAIYGAARGAPVPALRIQDTTA